MALGGTQSAVAKLERAADPRPSTIERYIAAVGRAAGVPAGLSLVATVADKELVVVLPLTTTQEASAMNVLTRSTHPAWRLRAWDDPMLEEVWRQRSIITMSADEIGDLSVWPGDRQVSERLSEAFPDRTTQAIGQFGTYWRYFRLEMRPGDIVAVPLSGRRVGIAEITGDYRYDPSEPEVRLRHLRPVQWTRFTSRAELDDDLKRVVNAPGTICRFKSHDAADRLTTSGDQTM
jgi:hypothetical protein